MSKQSFLETVRHFTCSLISFFLHLIGLISLQHNNILEVFLVSMVLQVKQFFGNESSANCVLKENKIIISANDLAL